MESNSLKGEWVTLTHTPKIRFVLRGNIHILQQFFVKKVYVDGKQIDVDFVWQDVPTEIEDE